jgi:hypothetical protein
MHVERDWIRAQAAFHGIAISDEDVEAIREILQTTKEALGRVRPPAPRWPEPPCGFLPPGFLPDEAGR